MSNSELLLGAAGVIDRNGWCPDNFYESVWVDAAGKAIDPEALVSPDDRVLPPRQCPVCPRGAIAVAAGMDPTFMAEVMIDAEPTSEQTATLAEVAEAEQALTDHLLDVVGWTPRPGVVLLYPDAREPEVIEAWADEDGRTLEEILTELRAVGEAEKAAGR